MSKTENTPPYGKPLTAETAKLLRWGDLVRRINGCFGEQHEGDCFLSSGCFKGYVYPGEHRPENIVFVARPDKDGTVPWNGDENPCPGYLIGWWGETRKRTDCLSDNAPWPHITRFRILGKSDEPVKKRDKNAERPGHKHDGVNLLDIAPAYDPNAFLIKVESREQPVFEVSSTRREPDEPMFVLLGRDEFAPYLVDIWALLRMGSTLEAMGAFNDLIQSPAAKEKVANPSSHEKIEEAFDYSAAMSD